ncbi:MAG: YdeI/OmpD-associated family protein [Bacillota bacterium]|nr:YdeI/OmpD-associated family protein [Bacillota bacterium]
MTDSKPNSKANEYLSKAKKWQKEMEKLRMILLDCLLTEEFECGKTCYIFQENNVAIIIGFKEYCALSFFKGSLFKDLGGILVSPGENSQSSCQIWFTGVQEIAEKEAILKDYIHEAIEVEKAGLKVNFKKSTEFMIPEEFQNKLDELPALKTAFDALTPGRQRAYILYFSAPIQSKTRVSRVEKCMQQILEGKGLQD